MVTTIQIHEDVKERLDNLKDFDRETYEDVIKKMLDIIAEEQMELSEQTKKDIEKARADFRAGKFVTLEQLKKDLRLK